MEELATPLIENLIKRLDADSKKELSKINRFMHSSSLPFLWKSISKKLPEKLYIKYGAYMKIFIEYSYSEFD